MTHFIRPDLTTYCGAKPGPGEGARFWRAVDCDACRSERLRLDHENDREAEKRYQARKRGEL